MRDWRTELDELLATSPAFAASIKSGGSRSPQRTAERIRGTPIDTWACSEREEINRRVASFKAHQQRLIHDRTEYADSVLSRLRGLPSSS
jgi:hypothetical protein